MGLKHTFVSAAGPGSDATKVDGDKWNDDHVVDTNGLKIAADATVPAAPAAGFVQLFGKTLAGAAVPAYIGPAGLDIALQAHIGRSKVGMWYAQGNSSGAPLAYGINVAQTIGGATQRVLAATNYFTMAIRSGYVSTAATAGLSCGGRLGFGIFIRGNGVGLGGFRAVFRFGCSDAATIADARTFVGLAGTNNALGNSNPSSNTNIIGMGTDSGESTFSIMHNDGSGAATKIALGANFPDHTLSTDLYELALFAAPNAAEVGWEVTRLNTGHTASGTITADLPASTQLLAPQLWRNNGTTALQVGIDLVSAYFEREY